MEGQKGQGEAVESPASVLVVDDSRADFDLCELFLDTVAPGAWRLDWAPDFGAGLAALREGRHDLALVDHGLGRDSGVQLIEQAVAAGCGVPMVLVTGSDNPEVERAGLAAGAIDFLPKNRLDARTLERTCRLTLQRERLFDSHRGSIERLASRNQALRILLHAADGLVVCTAEGRVVYLNPAAEELLAPSRGNSSGDLLPACLIEPEDGGEVVLPRAGGGERVLLVSVGEMRWEDAPCRLLSLRDVTSTQRLRHQVHQNEKMALLGQIAGGIAHEFNNLMMGVLGNIDLARSGGRSPAQLEAHLEGAAQAAGQASRLTSRLLAVARRKHQEPEHVDVSSLLQRVAPVLRVSTGDAIQLEVVSGAPLWVFADPLELEQVLLNLVSNARDAARAGGTVRISASPLVLQSGEAGFVGSVPPPGPAVVIAAQDDGCGIGSRELQRIFEPFYTAHKGNQGVGLGLAVVERVAREAGGGVRVASRPGRTLFEVVLPEAGPAPAEEGCPPPEQGAKAASLDILVVDDEAPVRDVVQQALGSRGHHVRTASDGLEALELVEQRGRPPDVLVTDISMPRMDGFELAEALRARHPGLPVIFISGLPEEFFERAGKGFHGRVEVLRKPFRLSDLERRLRSVLEEL